MLRRLSLVMMALLALAEPAIAQQPQCYESLRSYRYSHPSLRCYCPSAHSIPVCSSGSPSTRWAPNFMIPAYSPPPRPLAPSIPDQGQSIESARDQARQDREQAEAVAIRESVSVAGSLKGVTSGAGSTLKGGAPPVTTLKTGDPEFASGAFTPAQCQLAQRRIDAYREQFRQATETARRFNKTLAMDKALREEWENTMTAAVERAKARGQFLWLALPLGKLERVNAAAAAGLEKDGINLADLLASTADPRHREEIRIARQFVARDKAIVADLGKTYKQIGQAQSLGDNALLVFDDPDESPTSPFGAAGMKLREAGEMLFDLMVERDQWKKVAANSALARHLASGLAVAFSAEAAARAMFDSWYDAFATGLAWEQLNNMNLNEEGYLQAVQALRQQMTAQAERLHDAEQQFATECAKQS